MKILSCGGQPATWRSVLWDHLLHTYYSQSAYLRECVSRRLREMREQLGYEESPPLERILIEQILVCWINLYVLEINSATKLCESHSLNRIVRKVADKFATKKRARA